MKSRQIWQGCSTVRKNEFNGNAPQNFSIITKKEKVLRVVVFANESESVWRNRAISKQAQYLKCNIRLQTTTIGCFISAGSSKPHTKYFSRDVFVLKEKNEVEDEDPEGTELVLDEESIESSETYESEQDSL